MDVVKIHELREGEDLLTVARDWYGDASLWFYIWEANRDRVGDDPDAVEPPLTLVVPRLPTADIAYVVPATLHAGQYWNNRSLWGISGAVYGQPDEYRRIAEASGIGQAVHVWDDLDPGTVLRCPRLADPRLVRLARELRAKFGL